MNLQSNYQRACRWPIGSSIYIVHVTCHTGIPEKDKVWINEGIVIAGAQREGHIRVKVSPNSIIYYYGSTRIASASVCIFFRRRKEAEFWKEYLGAMTFRDLTAGASIAQRVREKACRIDQKFSKINRLNKESKEE